MKSLSITISFTLLISVWFCALHAFGAEPPMWTFDDKDAEKELKSWIDLNQLVALEIAEVKDKKGEKRKVLKTESLGGDPYMFPGGGWNVANYDPIDGTKYNILYMVEAEIDYISLKGAPTAVESNGKIAISWGQLKSKM